MRLAVPLLLSQVEAADRLSRSLPQWALAERALMSLGEGLPGLSPEETLLKVAAVNSLYYTNVYALARMAEHVHAVLAAFGQEAASDRGTASHEGAMQGPDLVERLADLPPSPGQKSPRKFTSFASKFAHFFIDRERFPIYDSYAVRMVTYHLGPANSVREPDHPYRSFVTNLERLRTLAGLSLSSCELDGYLWLAGQYLSWRRNRDAIINSELKGLFEAPSPEAAAELASLLG